MVDRVSAAGLASAGRRLEPRRGIIVRGLPPGTTDQDTLEVAFYKAVKGEMKCGVPEISSCHFTDNMQQAFVEFVDPTAITCLLRKPVVLQKHTLTIEEIDLNDVYQPYLIIRGLPPFMSEQREFLKTHFETLSNTQIRSIDVKGTEASIHFVNPSVTHDVASLEIEILASRLQLEVVHDIISSQDVISPNEEQVLTIHISGLPAGMATSDFLKMSILHYLMKAEIKTKSCDIVNGIAYVTLDDPSRVPDIISHPPRGTFLGNASLQYTSTPISKLPGRSGTQPLTSQSPPFSPPYQPSNPVATSTPSAGSQSHFPNVEGMKKEIPQDLPMHYDPTSSAGNQSQGYPIKSNSFQRNESSSSTSSQAWDPNASDNSMRFSQQKMNLSASSSSVKPIPKARSPHKWNSQGSADSSEGYVSYSSQMSPDYKNPCPGGVGLQYRVARSPPSQADRQYQQQDGGRSGSVGGGGYQQFTGPAQGHAVVPERSERPRATSGPISFEAPIDDQAEGLWMGEREQPTGTKRPNSAHQYQHPGQGAPMHPSSSDMYIEDIEIPCGQPVTAQQLTYKVHVQNIPPKFRNIGLQYYLERVMQNEVGCKVELFNADGVATFQRPIDMNTLIMRSRQFPLADSGGVLDLSPLPPTSTLIVSNIPNNTQEITLQYHFERLVGCNKITIIKQLSSDKALVTFVNSSCVQEVLANPHRMNLGYSQLIIKEYYPFMKVDETDMGAPTQPIVTQLQAPICVWSTQRERLSSGKYNYAMRTLDKLNKTLQLIKAKATLEEGKHLCITPLDGSSVVQDWEGKARTFRDEHFTDYHEDVIQIAREAQADVLSYVFSEDRKPSGVEVSLQGGCLTVSGSRAQVQKVLDEINEMMLAAQVSTKEIIRPRKHVRFLVKFCSQELDSAAPDIQYEAQVDRGIIKVTTNPQGLAAFEAVVEEQLKKVYEETIDISPDLYQLFSSKRGEDKITEVVGIDIPKIVYDFEASQAHGDYILCILSHDRETCRSVRKQLHKYSQSKAFEVNQQKIRACTDKKWRELQSVLTTEHFVVISVHQDTSCIVVSGEELLIDDVIKKIQKFLRDHTSVEEGVVMDRHVWNVVNLNFTHEKSALDADAKSRHVAITWPNPSSRQEASTIIIRGEPKDVDDFKTKVQMLGMKVCQKEATISKVPALVHVLGSMDDRINVLRTMNKASIELHFEKGTAEESQATGELPRNLCSATASTGSRINVYMGDFTQNQPVTAILNFVSLDPSIHVGALKLLSSKGGQEMQDDFKYKLSQLLVRRPGLVFQTKHGQLRCSQLAHCFLPPWSQSSAATMVQNLEEGLKNFLRNVDPSGTVLITPVTSKPLEYPVDTFSEKLLEVCSEKDIQVSVYVDEIDQARVFEDLLTDRKYIIHTHVPVGQTSKPTASLRSPTTSLTSARVISNPIKSFISLTQGDMLKQQAEVFVNSTNTNLNLKQGILSQKLLEICGDDLQKACSDFAPLNSRDVAVTDANNLSCKFIFHVALPDYGTKNSEREFRETVRALLLAAKQKGVTSIAIPSLGVGNLNYPASVSARILFDQVIAFHAQFPKALVQKFHFVIYEKKVYDEFSKEYAQRMNDGAQVKAAVDVHAPQKQSSGMLLGVFKVNIAEEATDVIVNTTTEDMNLSASAVSKAILLTAGPKLQMMCKQLVESGMKLERGQTVVMNATGGLRCKKIIQAYVPIRQVATSSLIDHFQLIGAIVTDCLNKVDAEGFKSVTFPAFGFGQGGYLVNEVADPILKAIREFIQTSPASLKTVRIAILDQDNYQQFYDYFCKFFDYDPSLRSPTSPGVFQTLKGKLGFGGARDDYIELSQGSTSRAQPPTPSPLWAVSRSVRSSNPVAIFQIYAASDQKCSEIEKCLRDDIECRAITKKLENVIVCDYMIEDDVEDIRKIEDLFGVEVKLMMQEKEIRISGETAKVSEAAMKIKDLVVEVERAESELRLFEWQCVDDDGAVDVYQHEASVKLERAHCKNLEGIEMIIENVGVMIDLKTMEEIDKSTGKRRVVKRVKKPRSLEYPDTWEDEPLKDGKPVTMHMFPVAAGTTEYQEAIKEFQDTIKLQHTVVEVKRIQNRNEYSKHIAFRDAISRKHGTKVDTRRLFHGSKQGSLELIAFQGFNRNFAADANAAYFGRGVYFAVNASYSAQTKYSAPDKDGNQHMFVCKVVIGKYTQGKSNMKVAPPLQPGSKDVFDSLVDNVTAPTIFVAMMDAQVYPEYLITFKVAGKK